MYAAAAFDELITCPICLERFTNPKTLPCDHVLCCSCIHGLCRGQPTVQCPVCRTTHRLPSGGVAALPDNAFINSLLNVSRETLPCEDCGAREGIKVVCQHCQTKLCADCLFQHGENTAVIREYHKLLKHAVSSKQAQTRTKQNVDHWRASIRDLEKDANEMVDAYDQAFKELSKRKANVQKAVDMLLKIEKGLYEVAQENADASVIYQHLIDQMANCSTIQSLNDLKNQLSMAKTAVQLLLSSDDQFRVVWDQRSLEAVKSFGRIEFGGELFNVEEGVGQTRSDTKEVKDVLRERGKLPQKVPANTDAGVESSVVIVETPGDRIPINAARNSVVPLQDASANTEESEQAEVVPVVRESQEYGEDCCASSSLSKDDSLPAVGCQSPRPRNINYLNKYKAPTTIIGGANDDGLKLSYPYSAMYSVQDKVLYVADHGNHRIMVYGVDGGHGQVFYRVNHPRDVAVSDAHVIVLRQEDLHLVNRDGVCTKITSIEGHHRPDCWSAECHDNHIIVLDRGNSSVIFYDHNGVYKKHFTLILNTLLQKVMECPQSLTVDKRGLIYVTESGKGECVKVFDWDGNYQEEFGNDVSMSMSDAHGICIDGDGFVNVARLICGRIDVYAPDRTFVCSYGRFGECKGRLQYPMTVRMMPDGRAIVCEQLNHRVQLF